MAASSTVEEVAATWREAAARLATAVNSTTDHEIKVALLRRLTRQLGRLGYPAFLKLLLIIAASDDTRAKQGLAEVIAHALQYQNMPDGPLTAWGASHIWTSQDTISAGQLPGHMFGSAPQRQYGPVEYLTVWYGQKTQRPYLSEALYRDALTHLIGLINHSPNARRLYPARIENDLATSVEGAYTRQTRARLATLACAWKQQQNPNAIAYLVIAGDTA